MILTRTEIETIISSVRVAVLAVDGKEELLVRDACIAHFSGPAALRKLRDAIDKAEDRERFRNAMREIGLESRRLGLRLARGFGVFRLGGVNPSGVAVVVHIPA